MNKSELIKQIADESGVTQSQATDFLNTFTKIIEKTVSKGEDISIPGFGAFVVAQRASRPARNFRTGKTITVPESKVVRFKVGKDLKEAVKPS